MIRWAGAPRGRAIPPRGQSAYGAPRGRRRPGGSVPTLSVDPEGEHVMKRPIYGFGLAVLTGLAANGVAAEPCEGVNARRSAKPVVVHKDADGSATD